MQPAITDDRLPFPVQSFRVLKHQRTAQLYQPRSSMPLVVMSNTNNGGTPPTSRTPPKLIQSAQTLCRNGNSPAPIFMSYAVRVTHFGTRIYFRRRKRDTRWERFPTTEPSFSLESRRRTASLRRDGSGGASARRERRCDTKGERERRKGGRRLE